MTGPVESSRHTRENPVQKSTILICLAIALTVAAVSAAVGAGTSSNLKDALLAQIELAEQRPDDASVLNDLGNLLALAGDPERAEEVYRRAVELNPQGVTPRFNLALLLQQRKDVSGAMHQLRRVIDLDPDHAWAHYQLGAIFEARGMNKQAIRSYARAFSLDPNLSFPEVNPHIIENKLVMAALLQAHRGQEDLKAPNSYDDAQRIASLLAPAPTFSQTWQPSTEEIQDEGMEATVEQAEAQPGRFAGSTQYEESSAGTGEEEIQEAVEEPRPVRVLTVQDLEPGRVNQASAPGRATGRGQAGGNRRTASEAQAARLRTWTGSRNSATPQGRAAGAAARQGSSSANQPGRATAIRSRFRPGLRSTGSLGSELLPVLPKATAKATFG